MLSRSGSQPGLYPSLFVPSCWYLLLSTTTSNSGSPRSHILITSQRSSWELLQPFSLSTRFGSSQYGWCSDAPWPWRNTTKRAKESNWRWEESSRLKRRSTTSLKAMISWSAITQMQCPCLSRIQRRSRRILPTHGSWGTCLSVSMPCLSMNQAFCRFWCSLSRLCSAISLEFNGIRFISSIFSQTTRSLPIYLRQFSTISKS